MKFSVVIPAYNEEKVIGVAVKSLRELSTPKKDFEIIVVDNNSKDKTSAVAKEAGADKVFSEKTAGTNFARERGRIGAEGEIVAFLDADCEAPKDWLSKIEANLKKDGVVATSGPYDHGFGPVGTFLDKLYTTHFMSLVPRALKFIFGKNAGVLIGGNFAAYSWALKKIGGLPPLAFWGDDAATAMLLCRKVGKVYFDPNLRIKSSPRRFKEQGFLKLTVFYIWSYLRVYFNKDFR
ncbi:MAG: glycosyltransferase family 2 protein [Candidatus Liptonbacteria bacterium]|nr:glycosyltransferase family 2 protein [Candidatus Liptonbacteria bacterium]